jgi:ABC-type Fe3+/spermidine/putrescine transport system ATPase subunit
VTKRYGAMRAADHVSLDIPDGTFFSLLGPSGSGKTTLLMIIAGFVAPDEGEVTLGKRTLTRVPPERRNFGMVFQGYALFPNLTVAGNVAFPLEVRRLGRAERDARVRAALDLVQLGGLADRLPKQLSGGQQQRVALARALVFEPEILLLDEPLSALDKKLRAGLQGELRELQRRLGKSFICVTHDQEEALSMSDAIAIVRDGRIAQTGAPRALFDQPASHFVADFLGESNFIRGVADRPDERGLLRYRAGDGWFTQAGHAAPAGETMLISLRPFKIEPHPSEPLGEPNRVSGRLTARTYRGTDLICQVETSIGPLSVSWPTWRAAFAPEPGQTVWLSWPPDASVVVTDDR